MPIVRGTYGNITIDHAGRVLRRTYDDPEDTEYDDIVRFDLTEWFLHYVEPLPPEFDIIDLGYWYVCDGLTRYDPPERDFR